MGRGFSCLTSSKNHGRSTSARTEGDPSVRAVWHGLGSLDELIHPFMMDSVENFQFNEDGPPQMNVPGFSFDGIGSAGLDSDGLFQGSLGTWKSGGSKSLEDVLATVRKRTRPVGAEAERRTNEGPDGRSPKRSETEEDPDIDEEDFTSRRGSIETTRRHAVGAAPQEDVRGFLEAAPRRLEGRRRGFAAEEEGVFEAESRKFGHDGCP